MPRHPISSLLHTHTHTVCPTLSAPTAPSLRRHDNNLFVRPLQYSCVSHASARAPLLNHMCTVHTLAHPSRAALTGGVWGAEEAVAVAQLCSQRLTKKRYVCAEWVSRTRMFALAIRASVTLLIEWIILQKVHCVAACSLQLWPQHYKTTSAEWGLIIHHFTYSTVRQLSHTFLNRMSHTHSNDFFSTCSLSLSITLQWWVVASSQHAVVLPCWGVDGCGGRVRRREEAVSACESQLCTRTTRPHPKPLPAVVRHTVQYDIAAQRINWMQTQHKEALLSCLAVGKKRTFQNLPHVVGS